MQCLWTTLFFLSTYVFLGSTTKHPIYTSLTEIDYKVDRKALEISVKVFADDMEKMLSKEKGEKIELGTSWEHPKATIYLMEYLQAHLKLKVDGKAIKYKCVGRENGGRSDMFAMYIYIEVLDVAPFKIIEVENSILIKEHSTQLNYIACHTSYGLKKVVVKKDDITREIKW